MITISARVVHQLLFNHTHIPPSLSVKTLLHVCLAVPSVVWLRSCSIFETNSVFTFIFERLCLFWCELMLVFSAAVLWGTANAVFYVTEHCIFEFMLYHSCQSLEKGEQYEWINNNEIICSLFLGDQTSMQSSWPLWGGDHEARWIKSSPVCWYPFTPSLSNPGTSRVSQHPKAEAGENKYRGVR